MKKITFFLLGFLFVQFSFGQTINWSYTIGSRIEPQIPTIASDGTIYIGSENNTNFHAINADGSLKWTYTGIIDNVYSSATIGGDGTIYVGAKDDFLHAINPDGTQKWKFAIGGDAIYSTPAIANDGTIYISSDSDKLFAVNSNGTQKWVFTTAGFNIRSTPAIATNGRVYIASDDNKLYALNPDGAIIWSYNLGGDVEGGVTLDTDGTIFVGVDENEVVANTGSVVALNPDGTLKWKSANTGRVLSSPALNNGFVYFGTKDTNKLFALNAATGVEAWSYAAGDIVISSPAIGDDGKIYFGSFDDKLYCLNADGTLNFDLTLSAFNLWSSPAIKNGKLYIGSYDGKLYSINIPSTNLASSNWPMFGKNLLHRSSDDTSPSLSVANFNSNVEQSLKVFYNNGILNINIEGYNKKATVSIFDLLGRTIKSQTLDFQSNTLQKLPLDNIKSGLYIINLKTENNSVIGTRKFIVKNN